MSMSDSLEVGILQAILNAQTYANVVDNAASSPIANVWVGLHTADPGDAGTQATSEIGYTGYTRVTYSRASGAWTLSGSTASNSVTITFGACTAVPSTASYVSVGTSFSGAGRILFSGAITSPASGLYVSAGITPTFASGALTITLD